MTNNAAAVVPWSPGTAAVLVDQAGAVARLPGSDANDPCASPRRSCWAMSNYADIARLASRLFAARKGHAGPAGAVEPPGWASIYQEAATDLPVAATLEAAIEWANELIDRSDRH